LDGHLSTSKGIQGTSPVVQDDTIQAMPHNIINYMWKEINSISFDVIILDETSDVMSKWQLYRFSFCSYRQSV